MAEKERIQDTRKQDRAVMNPSFTNSVISSSVSSLKFTAYMYTMSELTAAKEAKPKNPVSPR